MDVLSKITYLRFIQQKSLKYLKHFKLLLIFCTLPQQTSIYFIETFCDKKISKTLHNTEVERTLQLVSDENFPDPRSMLCIFISPLPQNQYFIEPCFPLLCFHLSCEIPQKYIGIFSCCMVKTCKRSKK